MVSAEALIDGLNEAMSSKLDDGHCRRLDNAIAEAEREYAHQSLPPKLMAKLIEATDRTNLFRASLARTFEHLFEDSVPETEEARLTSIVQDETLPVPVRDMAGAKLVKVQGGPTELPDGLDDRFKVYPRQCLCALGRCSLVRLPS